MRVTITGITPKGMAYLWLADHTRPGRIRSWLLSASAWPPVWVFWLLGFRGIRREIPLVFDTAGKRPEALA